MTRNGTLVICVLELEFSGYNRVVLNLIRGGLHKGNVIVLSLKNGPFAACYAESGAAVRIGKPQDIINNEMGNITCIIANCIMTADVVVDMSQRRYPVVWILHEWWEDEATIAKQLRVRNREQLTIKTVKQAFSCATNIVCVCHSQRDLYKLTDTSTVIYNGTPDPLPRGRQLHPAKEEVTKDPSPTTTGIAMSPVRGSSTVAGNGKAEEVFTFLCPGSIGPRKNQLLAVDLFQRFARSKGDSVRLVIVGARYIRPNEIEYLDKMRAKIGCDDRIEIHDTTDNMEALYEGADVLLMTSVNEVTPMVISEALSWSIPILATNVAGIKEMVVDGQEGILFSPEDEDKALLGMEQIFKDDQLREVMRKNARKRFETIFDLDVMVNHYRRLISQVAPPIVLLDMDGVLADWDKGFRRKWQERCPIDRTLSYYMEHCLIGDVDFQRQAKEIYFSKGFFRTLEPMEGALEAVKSMEEEGWKLYICTTPITGSEYCAQEKLDWVRQHLGADWLERVILTADKTLVVGDILIDDKPYARSSGHGRHPTPWKQIVFDAPYNGQVESGALHLPRISHWRDWQACVYPVIGKTIDN